MKRAGKLGLVPPRYGESVIGGAETVLRELAHGLAGRGWEVEVLTTCARDHFSWANEYQPGVHQVGDFTVRRFPAVVSTPRRERAVNEAAILGGAALTLGEQQRWMNDDMRVPELFHHLLDRAEEYRALVFAPYLFWTTFACSQVAPARSVLMACAHDEPYLRLDLFQPLFRSLAGVWFLSEPEHQLAHDVFPTLGRHAVVGCGMHVPAAYDPDGFRARHGIEGRFLVYAGRREGAKGWEPLLAGFARAVSRYDLPFSLVTFGTGDVKVGPELAGRVVDLGFLPDEERDNAFAAADACLQPSPSESFSRTVMEAWLAGTLVIANGASAVARWHCERSGAGLVYADEAELEQCLLFLAEAPGTAARLAASGRAYVLEHYGFDAVLDRVEATIDGWTDAT